MYGGIVGFASYLLIFAAIFYLIFKYAKLWDGYNNRPEIIYASILLAFFVAYFIQNIFSARALTTAFETGLIDLLIREPQMSADVLRVRLGLDRQGLALLLGLLRKNQVIKLIDSELQLTEEFRRALEFRNLLELKLSTANYGAHDLLNHFTEMVRRPRQSIGSLEFCRLFDYQKGLQDTPENYKWTKRWM